MTDTSFVIDIMAKEPGAVGKARELERERATIAIGSPTLFELFAGVALSRKAVEEKSKNYDHLVLTAPTRLGFSIGEGRRNDLGEKIKAGRAIDPEDAMLAGIAKAKAEKVLTRNIKHFSGIEGVTVETY